MRVLHAGCGQSRLPDYFPGAEEVRMDISEKHSPDIVANIMAMGDIGEFDAFYCCHVLEHIDDYRKGIAELFRILRGGGSGIIAVPQTPGLARSERTHEAAFQESGYVWEFGDDFADRLRDAGFRVRTVVVPADGSKKKPEPMPYHLVHKP